MAIRPDQLAPSRLPVTEKAKKEKDKKNAPKDSGGKTPPSWEARVKKNEFLNVQSSQTDTDRRLRAEGTLEDERATFTEPLRRQYINFLDNYVRQLYEMNKRNPNILLGADHAHDRLIFNQLVNGDRLPDEEKIKQFLGGDGVNSANWEITTLALEHHMSRMIAALGIHAATLPRGEKGNVVVDDRLIHLGIDQGLGNQLWSDYVMRFLDPGVHRTGDRPDPNSMWGRRRNFFLRTMRRGVVIDIRQCTGFFESITNDPNEMEFMTQMTGIDLSRYRVAGGAIQLIPGMDHRITKNPEQTLKEVMGTLFTRQEFYTTLRVPYRYLDELPEQFLFLQSANPQEALLMEQTGFRGNKDVYDEFLASLPGGVINPADYAGNLQKWREARAKVITKKIKEQINAAREKAEREKIVSILKKRKDNLESIKGERKKAYADRKDALDKDIGSLTTEKGNVSQYQSRLNDFQEKIEETRIKNQGDLNNLLSSLRMPGGGTFPGPDAALAALRALLDSNSPSAVIDGVPISSTFRRYNLARAAFRAAAPGQNPGESNQDYQRRLQRWEAEKLDVYNQAKVLIDQDASTIKDTIVKIKEAIRLSTLSIPENLKQSDTVVAEALKTFQILQRDFDDITGWENRLIAVGLPGVGLTEANLSTQTVEQILTKINQAYAANNELGWIEGQNNNPELRLKIIHTITEAKARQLNPLVRAPGAEFTLLTTTWGITEHQLNTFTAEQIRQLIESRQRTSPARYPGVLPGVDQIDIVKEVSNDRTNARIQAMNDADTFLKMQSREEERINSEIDRQFEDTGRRDELTIKIASGQERILGLAGEMEANYERFFDSTLVAATDDISDQERAAYLFPPPPAVGPPVPGAAPRNYSRGYLEILNVLTKYQEAEEGAEQRGELFERARQIITPEELAMILDETVVPFIGPVIGPRPVRNDLEVVFNDIRGLMDTGQASWVQIQEGLQRVIDTVVRRRAATTI